MGPRAGLDKCGKSRPPPGFDPRTVQPVPSRYTDYAARPTIKGRLKGDVRTKPGCRLCLLAQKGALRRAVLNTVMNLEFP